MESNREEGDWVPLWLLRGVKIEEEFRAAPSSLERLPNRLDGPEIEAAAMLLRRESKEASVELAAAFPVLLSTLLSSCSSDEEEEDDGGARDMVGEDGMIELLGCDAKSELSWREKRRLGGEGRSSRAPQRALCAARGLTLLMRVPLCVVMMVEWIRGEKEIIELARRQS